MTYFNRICFLIDSDDLCVLVQRNQVIITERNVRRRVSASQNAHLLLMSSRMEDDFRNLSQSCGLVVILRRTRSNLRPVLELALIGHVLIRIHGRSRSSGDARGGRRPLKMRQQLFHRMEALVERNQHMYSSKIKAKRTFCRRIRARWACGSAMVGDEIARQTFQGQHFAESSVLPGIGGMLSCEIDSTQ